MEIELPDGTVLDAPDDADVKKVVRGYYARRQPAPAAAQRTGPDPFAGDELLSDEAIARKAAGESIAASSPTPSVIDRAVQYGKDYVQGLQKAGEELAQPSNDLPGVGTAETLGTLVTGLFSPVTGAIRSAATGEPYRQARDAQVYRPRTQSGRAMTGGLGALVKPVGDAFEVAGRKVGDALDFVPGVTREGGQEAGAAAVDALGLASTLRGPRPMKAPKQKPAEIPSTQELTAATNAAYKEARDAGVIITPQSFSKFAADTAADLTKAHLNPTLHPGATAALKEIGDTVKSGKPLTLEEMDQIRQIVRDASGSRADGRMTRKILSRLDAYLDGLTGKDLAAGDAPAAVASLKRARELNRRKENSAMFDELLRKAGINAKAKFTQAGDEHAWRSEFKKLALRKDFTQKFTPSEQEAITKIAAGGSFENAMRDLGKFDPTSGGMSALVAMGTGGIGGVMATGGLEGSALGLVIPTAGFVAKRIATRATKRNVEKARESVVGRGLPKGATASPQTGARRFLGVPPVAAPRSERNEARRN